MRRFCADVGRCVREGRAPLVLTERIDHLEALAGGLRAIGASVIVLRGGMGSKLLKAALMPTGMMVRMRRRAGSGDDIGALARHTAVPGSTIGSQLPRIPRAKGAAH